jgi:hypothetical protein
MVLLASLALLACARPASTPEAAVVQFYTVLDALGIRRVPDATQRASLREFVTPALLEALAAADRARRTAEAAAPNEKPPFADGDPFSSLFEGRTSQRVLSTTARGDTSLVLTAFTNDDQKPPVSWQDTILVVQRNGKPVIADIRYGTTWEFGYRGSLLKNLTSPP